MGSHFSDFTLGRHDWVNPVGNHSPASRYKESRQPIRGLWHHPVPAHHARTSRNGSHRGSYGRRNVREERALPLDPDVESLSNTPRVGSRRASD